MIKIVFITGGNRERSRLTGLIQFAKQYLERERIQIDIIQVHQLEARALIEADYAAVDIQTANQKVLEADGIIIFTPIFKAAYSGILKTYLDLLPPKAFERKTVLPLAIGGSVGHVLAIQYTLDPVIKELGAELIHRGRFVVDKQIELTEENTFKLAEEVESRLTQTLAEFEDALKRPIHI